MKRSLIIVLACFLLLLGCKESKKETQKADQNIEIIKIPAITQPKGKPEVKLSSIIDSTFSVRLETKEACIIGYISKVIVSNERIYVLDAHKSKSVFEFTMNGKFIRQYGKKGKGPGEYSYPTSFVINTKKKQLIILDRGKRKLLTYTLDGVFVRAKKIKASFSEFELTDSGFIVNTHNTRQGKKDDNREFSLAIINRKGEVTSQFLKAAYKIGKLVGSKGLLNSQQGLFFREPYTNLVYKITKNNTIPTYKFEFEDTEIPKKLFNNVNTNPNSFFDELKNKNYAYVNSCFFIGKIIAFNIQNGKMGTKCFYSLNTKKLYQTIYMENDVESLGFSGQTIGTYNNFLISYIQSAQVKRLAKYTKSESLKKFIENTKPSDNPILIFNSLREAI